jgi:K+-transporting ATPase ATPase B chain
MRSNSLESLKLAFVRLNPKYQIKNPVMFVVFISACLTTIIFVQSLFTALAEPTWFIGQVTFWLWFTIIFANFAESLAEGQGKAQAETLKKSRREVTAKLLKNPSDKTKLQNIPASQLHKHDVILIEAGDFVPADGQVIEGIATVDESAITGESAPVIRENGGDRDAVTGGTKILSDWLVVRVTCDHGESFLDRMIGMVEGAKRQKTPNEIALSILLCAMTIIFLLVCVSLIPFSIFAVEISKQGSMISITTLIALLVCLIPTTIGGLLSAIGISGMQRLLKANVIATSGRAVEAAGDVSVLLLDKTGTITFGNRQAVEIFPASGIKTEHLAEASLIASIADDTPEGRSIVTLTKSKYSVSENNINKTEIEFIPFSAETRISGAVIGSRKIIKGSSDAIEKIITSNGGKGISAELQTKINEVSKKGGTPLIVADGDKILGMIYLKDVVKPDIKQRLAELRKMGIKSVMITGDNPLTAAAIASEAGVDDFIAQATPEAKLKYIRQMQEGGQLVAMVGDGTNDAPALAQADVAVAMNSGTQAAKEAGNMVDLDSNPTKLIEVVEIGKQLLMTRGALTTFSISNDIAKYFAIIPAVFVATYPQLEILNIMNLSSPLSAILSAVIFNALIIIALIPLALKGVKYEPLGASAILKRNFLIYGIGGIIIPFIGIKCIDILLTLINIF